VKQTEFEIETITPMFMSGADQGKVELRPSSFLVLTDFVAPEEYDSGSEDETDFPGPTNPEI